MTEGHPVSKDALDSNGPISNEFGSVNDDKDVLVTVVLTSSDLTSFDPYAAAFTANTGRSFRTANLTNTAFSNRVLRND